MRSLIIIVRLEVSTVRSLIIIMRLGVFTVRLQNITVRLLVSIVRSQNITVRLLVSTVLKRVTDAMHLNFSLFKVSLRAGHSMACGMAFVSKSESKTDFDSILRSPEAVK